MDSVVKYQPEDLLKLIYEDKLTKEKMELYKHFVNYSKGDGYFTPLMVAIHNKKKYAMQILITAGADPSLKIKVRIYIVFTTSFRYL